MLLGQSNQLDEEVLLDHSRRRIVRKVNNDNFGFRNEMFAGVGDVAKEFFGVSHIQSNHVAGRQHHRVHVNRK